MCLCACLCASLNIYVRMMLECMKYMIDRFEICHVVTLSYFFKSVKSTALLAGVNALPLKLDKSSGCEERSLKVR